jgi:hypothetical protein
MIAVVLGAILGLIFAFGVITIASFAIAAILTVTWNVVVPYFGGPSITFWVAYAGYWLLSLVSMTLRGGANSSKKEDPVV